MKGSVSHFAPIKSPVPAMLNFMVETEQPNYAIQPRISIGYVRPDLLGDPPARPNSWPDIDIKSAAL
jgi:hypothetical protein